MPQIAFLNEKSYPQGPVQVERALCAVNKLLDLMIYLRRIMPRISLVANEKLLTLQIGDNYSISKWLNEVPREKRQLMLSLANLAPFEAVGKAYGEREVGVTVYRIRGGPFAGLAVEGIGLAEIYGGLAVSFTHDARWSNPLIPVHAEQLAEDGEQSWESDIRHATEASHVDLHRPWLLEKIRTDLPNHGALWAERATIFPRLRFLEKVEGDLAALELTAFHRVTAWLFAMNASIEEWAEGALELPNYPPHTTDEGETRSRYFWWADGDNLHCFSWHGRFTPNAGRIHFRLAAAEKKVVIGYIGPKVLDVIVR